MSLPVKKPRWATTLAANGPSGSYNVEEPSEAKKDYGWNYQEKPPRNYVNWLAKSTYDWIDHLDIELNQFSVYQSDPDTPDMTIKVGAGRVYFDGAIVSVAEQTSGTITAPTTNDRIDRVLISRIDGTLSIVTGAESATPSAPAVTVGSRSVAQIYLTPAHTTIQNSDITDEKPSSVFSGISADSDGGVRILSGNVLISPTGDSIDPINGHLELYRADSNDIFMRIANGTTGAANGFRLGIDSSENAEVWNLHSSSILFGTNDTFRGKINSAGKWLINVDGGGSAVVPNWDLQIHNSTSAAVGIQFTNLDTGSTATDGTILYVDGTNKNFNIRQYEAAEVRIVQGNTLRAKFDAVNGYLLLDPHGDSVEPQSHLHIYQGTSAQCYTQFSNLTTTETSGFYVGIDGSEKAVLNNVYNSDMLFFTNNTFRGKFTASGGLYLSYTGTDTTPSYDLHMHRNTSDNVYIHLTNTTTGTLSTNGILIGLDGSENLRLHNYYAADTIFHTNNVERMRIASNVYAASVAGGTFQSWHSNYAALQIGNTNAIMGHRSSGSVYMVSAAYFDQTTSSWLYSNAAYAGLISVEGNNHSWKISDIPGASVGDAVTWKEMFRVVASTKVTYLAENGGVVFGNPTGGNKGIGSLNAETLYINGVQLTTGTVVSGYSNATSINFHSTAANTTSFNITAVIGAAWESVGGTGSGATNIWTAMNDVPSSAKAVIVKCFASYGVQYTSSGDVNFYLDIYARTYNGTASTGEKSIIEVGAQETKVNGDIAAYKGSSEVIIPINNGKFDLYVGTGISAGTGAASEYSKSGYLYLVGWIE